jgi:cytochrome oxidase Cu insertion factor (SCO1/SenC/PrrC family)
MDYGSGSRAGDERRHREAGFRLSLAGLGALIVVAVLSGCRSTQPDATRESAPTLTVGDAAPEFSLQAADGSEVTLQSVTSGRPALFYFSMGPG